MMDGSRGQGLSVPEPPPSPPLRCHLRCCPALPSPTCCPGPRPSTSQYGLPPPKLRKPLPRTITFQCKRANRRVVNEPELLSMLREFGEVGLV